MKTKTTAPTTTAILTEFLRKTSPEDTVPWSAMEGAIGKHPKMYWKGARRALKKDGICFSIVDGIGLRRISGRMVNRAVKVELAPRGRKLEELRQNVGFSRFVWNWALGQQQRHGAPIGGKTGAAARREAVERKKRGEKCELTILQSAEVSRRWTCAVNKDTECGDGECRSCPRCLGWTKDRIGSVARFAIQSMSDAYSHAKRRSRAGDRAGWPKFRKRSHRHRGFTLQDQSFRCTRWAIKIGKLGMIPIRNARRHDQLDVLDGARVLRLVVEERAGRWWCSIMYEREHEIKVASTGKISGIDLGYAITISDGTDAPPVYNPPMALDRHLLWLKHWGRAVSRRQPERGRPASKRYRRAQQIVAELHLRIACLRKDWIEQVSDDLVKRYDVLVVEGFDVKRLVSEEVGYRKGRRTILDIGWGMLRTRLAAKAEDRGKRFEKLEEFDLTDQTCSRCAALDERVDGLFQCPDQECGHEDTRPRNTADLLRLIGMGEMTFGGDAPETPAGEAGVNARGARKRTVRRPSWRGSEIGCADAQGGPALQGPQLST